MTSLSLSYLLKLIGTTLIFSGILFTSDVSAKLFLATCAYLFASLAWFIAIKRAGTLDKLCRESGLFAVLRGRLFDRQRIRELEEAVEEAMIYFESEWETVDRHPASRFGREYEYYHGVLHGREKDPA